MAFPPTTGEGHSYNWPYHVITCLLPHNGLSRWREWCGLHPMNTWEDLLGVMANHSVKGYSELYANPEDMDLWTAGISERPLPGSMVGPTFACIIGKQFHNFR